MKLFLADFRSPIGHFKMTIYILGFSGKSEMTNNWIIKMHVNYCLDISTKEKQSASLLFKSFFFFFLIYLFIIF